MCDDNYNRALVVRLVARRTALSALSGTGTAICAATMTATMTATMPAAHLAASAR